MKAALLLLALVALAATADARQQDPLPAGGAQGRTAATLRGRVVGAADTIPLRRARVTLLVSGQPPVTVFADESGDFELPLPAAAFALRVTKAGYAPFEIGRQRPAAEPITVPMIRGAVIAGRLVDGRGSESVGMTVRIRRVAPPVFEALTDTDDRGEFRFGNLAAGRYELTSIRGAELSAMLEDRDPATAEVLRREIAQRMSTVPALAEPVVVDVGAGDEESVTLVQNSQAVSLPYAQVGGAVSGVLIDETGEPAERVTVRLWSARTVEGRQLLAPIGRSRTVDELGRYRLFHVPAGRYFLVATPAPELDAGTGETARFLQVYFPGRFDAASATPITIQRSQEVSGVDMMVPRTRGARLYGVALSSSGQPLAGSVLLVPSRGTTPLAAAAAFMGSGLVPAPLASRTAPDGSFEIRSVPPGNYVLQAAATINSTREAHDTINGVRAPTIVMQHVDGIREFGIQRVSVADADVGPLALTTVPTSTITGRVTVDGPGQLIVPGEFSFNIAHADPDEVPAAGGYMRPDVQIDSSGRFRITGLTGRSLVVLTRAPPGWWLKSVDIGGFNAAGNPVAFGGPADSRDDVTMVLATTGATLGGRVAFTADTPSFSIVVFPVDAGLRLPASRYMRTTSPGADGSFLLNSFPPGDYYVIAVREDDSDATGDWENAETLEQLAPLAERVTLAARETRHVELRVVSVPR